MIQMLPRTEGDGLSTIDYLMLWSRTGQNLHSLGLIWLPQSSFFQWKVPSWGILYHGYILFKCKSRMFHFSVSLVISPRSPTLAVALVIQTKEVVRLKTNSHKSRERRNNLSTLHNTRENWIDGDKK